jgi:hypothetical protein
MTAIQKPSVKPLVVSRRNAAALLDVSVDKIDELISWGKLQTVKLGLRRVGIKMASVEKIADEGVGNLERRAIASLSVEAR